MDVLEIPFNKFLGLKRSEKEEYLLTTEDRTEYKNHVGTSHASLMFALAEASGGEFLLNKFEKYDLNIIPVVRKVDVKFSKPGNGKLFSKASFFPGEEKDIISELKARKRVIIKIKVELLSEKEEKLMTSIFDWFITVKE